METQIQKVIDQLKQLEIAKENILREIKVCEDHLKSFMLNNKIEEVHGLHGEKIIYREVLGKRFDTKSFKECFESLYNSYLKNTRTLRFKFSY